MEKSFCARSRRQRASRTSTNSRAFLPNMNWEAVAALGSVLSATVIAVTVIFASRQVKVAARQAQLTNDQLNHLRRSTQLEGAMRIFDEMDKPEFREAVRFVVHDLRSQMQDPAF